MKNIIQDSYYNKKEPFTCSRCGHYLTYRQTSVIIEDWIINENSGDIEEIDSEELVRAYNCYILCLNCDVNEKGEENPSPENLRFNINSGAIIEKIGVKTTMKSLNEEIANP